MSDTRVSSTAVEKATGKGWDHWFKVLDKFDVAAKGHKAAAAFLKDENNVSPWWSQTISIEYEIVRGLREARERSKGFGVDAQRTVSVGIEKAWNAWTIPSELNKWFTSDAKVDLKVGGRYSNADKDAGTYKRIDVHKLLRFTWEQKCHQPGSVVDIEFTPKGDEKTTVKLSHTKLKVKDDAENLKLGWSWAMDSLKSYLNTGQPITYEDWEENKLKNHN